MIRGKTTRIGLAIAGHKSWEGLEHCLEHLLASQQDAELLVVGCDNGSTDVWTSRKPDRSGVTPSVTPDAPLETTTTGLCARNTDVSNWRVADAVRCYWSHLTDRKAGAQLEAWWTITRRHVPWYGAVPTSAFVMGLGTFRFWQREPHAAVAGKRNGARP